MDIDFTGPTIIYGYLVVANNLGHLKSVLHGALFAQIKNRCSNIG